MEAKTAFIWANSTAKLYSESPIYLHFTVIIHPRNSEGDDSFRFNESLKYALTPIFRMFCQYGCKGVEDFFDRLVEDNLIGVAFDYRVEYGLNILFCCCMIIIGCFDIKHYLITFQHH